MMRDEIDPLVRNQRLDGAEWSNLRQEILARDGKQCANCGADENLEVHHVVPLSRGGTNKRTNLLTVCSRCHNHTHDKQIHDQEGESETHRWLPTIADIRQLVRSTPHPLKKAVIGLFAKTGIGVGELCNLNISDISLVNSDVFDTYTKDQQRWTKKGMSLLRVQVSPKNDPYSARRERSETTVVPLDDELRCFIEHWLAIRPDAVSRTEPLFLSTSDHWGRRLSPSIVRPIVKKTSEELRFVSNDSTATSITPYDLRYFFAERFPGQPRIRDYILGRRVSQRYSIERVHREYTRQIYYLS